MVPSIEEDTRPCQKDKCGSAEVSDPAGKENSGRRTTRRNAGKHPHVIDRHQDHRRAANEIDRCDPNCWRGVERNRSSRSSSTHKILLHRKSVSGAPGVTPGPTWWCRQDVRLSTARLILWP